MSDHKNADEYEEGGEPMDPLTRMAGEKLAAMDLPPTMEAVLLLRDKISGRSGAGAFVLEADESLNARLAAVLSIYIGEIGCMVRNNPFLALAVRALIEKHLP